jgi:DNA-binding SARP family transcriptional activator
MGTVPEWFLAALSGGALRAAERSWVPERKSAALLVYLALEGPTARYRLAGLLWPAAPETAARNNLAQAVRRLRVACGADVVAGGDRLALGDGVRCDAGHFDPFAEPWREPSALLSSHDYDDCPEFAEWLEGARERLRRRARAAWLGRAEALEADGRWREALAAHDRLLDLEPLDETAHRGRMRSLQRMGERAAAQHAFARCRDALAGYGLTPSPSTTELAKAILAGADLAPDPPRMVAPAPDPLALLPESAQRMAWVAAVAGPSFSAPLAEDVLGSDAFELVEAWRLLEAAGVLVGARFADEGVRAAAFAAVPTAVRATLHRRVASALERAGAPAAQVAAHWSAGDAPAPAARWWRRAAEEAERGFRYAAAADAHERAARCFERLGDEREAFVAFEAATTHRFVAGGVGLDEGIAALDRLARTPDERAQALRAAAEWHCRGGRLDDAERAAAAACGWAERGCDVGGVLDALNTLAGTLVERGRHGDAAAWLERAVALCRLHAAPELPTAINNLALVRQAVGALHEALERHAEAFELARGQGRLLTALAALNNQGRAHLGLGRPDAAEAVLRRALELGAALPDAVRFRVAGFALLGASLGQLARFDEALASFRTALGLAETHGFPDAEARLGLAELVASLGAADEALELLAPVRAAPGPQQLPALLTSAACVDRSADAEGLLERARELAGFGHHLAWRHRYLRLRVALHPEEAQALVMAMAEARMARVPPLVVAAALRLARVDHAAGRTMAAAARVAEAEHAARATTSRSLQAELRRVRLLVASAAGDAAGPGRADRTWLRRAAAGVPARYRERFRHGAGQVPSRLELV